MLLGLRGGGKDGVATTAVFYRHMDACRFILGNTMGIQVEFNPDLALRNISEFKMGIRHIEECIPEILDAGGTYIFLKEGQRNFFLKGEIALVETKGNENISKPLASIKILEAKHFLENEKIFTRGKYMVMEIIEDDDIHFNGFEKVRASKKKIYTL